MKLWGRWSRRRGTSPRQPDRPAAHAELADCLRARDAATRNLLFDALRQADEKLFYTEHNPERFIVNCQDNFISRTLFVNGIDACEFSKFVIMHEILRQRESFPQVFDTLVDVGANLGVICIPAVLRGYCRRAVAIEPHPENCRILRANIALNGLHDRIAVLEAAASNQDNVQLDLAISPVNAGDHRIICRPSPGLYGEKTWATIKVPSMRLDSLEECLHSASCLIWMDIQGFEGLALTGALALLKRQPPLALEFWPYGMERANSFAPMMQAIAHYKGFYVVQEDARLQPLSDLPLLWDRVGTTGDFVDILVI